MAGIESHANWDVCWHLPLSGSQSGGGLQILTARYDGRTVLRRGSQPFVIVPYHTDHPEYKDGLNHQGAPFSPIETDAPNANTIPPNPRNVNLSQLVEVEKKGPTAVEPAKLEIWAKFQVGWYQYVHRWEFLADGRIKPGVGLGGPLYPSVPSRSHIHNFYFRLDFAIGQGGDQVIEEQTHSNSRGDGWSQIRTETKQRADSMEYPRWRIREDGSDESYELVPGSVDAPDSVHSTGDFWVVRREGYGKEMGAQVATGSPPTDAHLENGYGSGQSIVGEDVIIWYVLREHHHPIEQGEEQDTLPYHFFHFELKPRDFLNNTPRDLYATTPSSP